MIRLRNDSSPLKQKIVFITHPEILIQWLKENPEANSLWVRRSNPKVGFHFHEDNQFRVYISDPKEQTRFTVRYVSWEIDLGIETEDELKQFLYGCELIEGPPRKRFMMFFEEKLVWKDVCFDYLGLLEKMKQKEEITLAIVSGEDFKIWTTNPKVSSLKLKCAIVFLQNESRMKWVKELIPKDILEYLESHRHLLRIHRQIQLLENH